MVRHRQAEAECARSGFSAALVLALIGLIAFAAVQMLRNDERAGRAPRAAEDRVDQSAEPRAQAAIGD